MGEPSTPLTSFVPVPEGSHFPIQNLPFGVFRPAGGASARVGVALGDHVVDLSVLADEGLFSDCGYLDGAECFHDSSLNEFMAMGRGAWLETRSALQSLLSADEPKLRDNGHLRTRAILHQSLVSMELPARIGNYTDFYSSREHATNVGALFRSRETALNPNWLHLPVAYHGRASSIIPSGTPVPRPQGQLAPPADAASLPPFGPSQQLDFELEMGFLVGPGNVLGEPIPVEYARDHVFGMVLVNDWSARDIQKWEYVPLGPFLSKSFATSVSPWVVTLDALEPFRCAAPEQANPQPLPYLLDDPRYTYNIELEVRVTPPAAAAPSLVSCSNFRHLYWTIPQQVAHHTVGGCPLRTGDLLASGTISGPHPSSLGCLLEMTKGGTQPLELLGGVSRTFLEDGDTVTMTGFCHQGAPGSVPIGFGDCTGRVAAPGSL